MKMRPGFKPMDPKRRPIRQQPQDKLDAGFWVTSHDPEAEAMRLEIREWLELSIGVSGLSVAS